MAIKKYGDQNGRSTPEKKPAQKAYGGSTDTFIKRELSADEQAACKAQPFTAEDLVAQLGKLTGQGYKITFRVDSYSNADAVWIMQTDGEHANAGYILSGRGSSALKAFKQALYKHYNLCMDENWKDLDKSSTFEIDD